MKIVLDRVELRTRTNNAGTQQNLHRSSGNIDDLYVMSEMPDFVIAILVYSDHDGKRLTRHVMLPMSNVLSMTVADESVPCHQPLGTDPRYDTPSGRKRKRTMADAKKELAERIEA